MHYEVKREIHKRLIVDCTFIYDKVTVKALIDPKSQYDVDSYQKPSRPRQIVEREREKRQYRCRKNLWELPFSLHTFYELLFPDFTAIDSDREAIITKFSKHKREFNGLSKYCDTDYSETESSSSEADSSDPETDSEAEDAEDVPPLMIMGTADTTNDLLPHLEIFLDRMVVTMIILFPHFSIGN
ncbi:hypothetical protein C1646_757394 [Rhizophagus diaphanus]|nr:hypothetical protein C1646_757394 [Rhizophagus diaphanus] [Rhizophagus sp. MUCL 43196]